MPKQKRGRPQRPPISAGHRSPGQPAIPDEYRPPQTFARVEDRPADRAAPAPEAAKRRDDHGKG